MTVIKWETQLLSHLSMFHSFKLLKINHDEIQCDDIVCTNDKHHLNIGKKQKSIVVSFAILSSCVGFAPCVYTHTIDDFVMMFLYVVILLL